MTAGFGWLTRGLDLALPRVAGHTLTDRRSRLLLAVVVVLIGCVCGAVWLSLRRIGGGGEVTSFFGPMYDNYVLGQHFYRDLDFPYGPLLAFGPVVLAKLTGFSMHDSYALAWLLESMLGVALVFKTVDLLGIASTARARVLFLVLMSFFYNQLFSEGLQYTPVRFFMAPLLALWLYRRYRRGDRPLRLFLLTGLGNAVILFYSPEHGIQFFLGTMLFFIVCVRPSRASGLVGGLAVFTGMFAVAIAIAGRMGILGFFFHSSGGALNLPLLLGPPTLVEVLFVLAAGVTVAAAVRLGRLDHPWVYLVALSLFTLPVALGRCDPGHLFVNLIGAFLAVFAVLSASRIRFGVACVAFLLIVQRDLRMVTGWVPQLARDGLRDVVIEPTPLHALARRYQAYLVRHLGTAAAQQMLESHQRTQAVQPGVALPSGTAFFAPFGTTRVARPTGNARIFTGSYPGYTIYAPYAEAEKMRDMREQPQRLLLVPDGWTGECIIGQGALDGLRAQMHWIFQTSLVPALGPPQSPWQPMCNYIGDAYVPTAFAPPLPGVTVWQRKR